MTLEYKPDWEKARQRLEAFWAGEELERPIIIVTAPNGRQPRQFPPSTGPRGLDYERRLDFEEDRIRCTYYGGEAVPSVWPDFGPNITAACLGGRMEVHEADSISGHGSFWTYPVIEDWDRDLPQVRFDPENVWWQRILEFTQLAVERAKGKYLVTIPDIDGGCDTCDSLRGTSDLCVDLYENPGRVKQLVAQVREANVEITWRLYTEISRYHTGCVSTFRIWGPGPFYNMRADFSYLVHPSTFCELFLEDMMKEAEALGDCTLFHCHQEDYAVNREGRLAWLDVVLSIPHLKGVEWHIVRWDDLEPQRKILAAGKFVFCSVNGSDIPHLVEALGSKRLFILTGASCPEEADAIVKAASSV